MYSYLLGQDFKKNEDLSKNVYCFEGKCELRSDVDEGLAQRTVSDLITRRGMQRYLQDRVLSNEYIELNNYSIRSRIEKSFIGIGIEKSITLREAKQVLDREVERVVERLFRTNKEAFKRWGASEKDVGEIRKGLYRELEGEKGVKYEEVFKLIPLQNAMRKVVSEFFAEKEKKLIEQLAIKKESGEEILEKLHKFKGKKPSVKGYIVEKLGLQAEVWSEFKKIGRGYEKFPFEKLCMWIIDLDKYEEWGDYAFENESGGTVCGLRGLLYALRQEEGVVTKEQYIKVHDKHVEGLSRGFGVVSRLRKNYTKEGNERLFFRYEKENERLEDWFLGCIEKEFRNEENFVRFDAVDELTDALGLRDFLYRAGSWFMLNAGFSKGSKELKKMSEEGFSVEELISSEKIFEKYKKDVVFKVSLNSVSREECHKRVDRIFNGFKRGLKLATGYKERMIMYLWLQRELATTHPFVDGNARTAREVFVSLVKGDREMPGVLIHDPNIEFLSPAGMLKMVIGGMERFRKLSHLKDKEGVEKIEALKEFWKEIEKVGWGHWHEKVKDPWGVDSGVEFFEKGLFEEFTNVDSGKKESKESGDFCGDGVCEMGEQAEDKGFESIENEGLEGAGGWI